MKKSLKIQKTNRKLIYSLAGAGALVLLLLSVQFAWLLMLHRQVHVLASDKIGYLFIDSVEDLQRDMVVDPQTGRAHIPSARLVLPPQASMAVSYSADPDEVYFADNDNLQAATGPVRNGLSVEEKFAGVPNLQACSRQVKIQYNQMQDDEEYRLVHTKTLSDGRSAFLYLSGKCNGASDRLVAYLKQIDSY